MKIQIQAFINYLTNERRYSIETIKAYSKDLEEFHEFLLGSGDDDLLNIDYHDIRLFIAHLNENNLSRRSISRKLSTLRSFFKYLVLNQVVEKNPMDLIQYSIKKKTIPDFFYPDEIEKIFASLSQSQSKHKSLYSAILETLYATGMRVQELCDLRLAQIDFNVALIRVIGKGNKERIVPVGDYAIKSLQDYINGYRKEVLQEDSQDYVFLSTKGRQLSPTSVRNILNKIIQEAGLNLSIHPHKLRHTFATHLLNNGADMRSVQELLGHEDLSSTQIYTHVTKDKLREDYLAIFPRAKRQSKEDN